MYLDRPIPEQYVIWLENAFQGDLGESWVNNTEVIDDLVQRIPVTLELIFLALLLVFLVLVPLAIITASRTRNWIVRMFQNVTFGYGMLAGALPDFLLGLVLIFFLFAGAAGLMPAEILPGPEGRLGILDFEPPFVTGSILIDSLIAGDMEIFWSGFMHLIMPVFTLAFVYGAPIFKMLRSQMEGALKADYTTYAEAVGLAPRIVLTRAARVAAAADAGDHRRRRDVPAGRRGAGGAGVQLRRPRPVRDQRHRHRRLRAHPGLRLLPPRSSRCWSISPWT